MMWMMGYNDGGDVQDPFSGRRLRPLMPRPANADSTSAPSLARIHGNELLTLNNHLAAMAEQGKRDLLNTQQVVVTSRWNPTPEQLQTLEELYSRGTRTPSAEQIQQITAQLRRYGKIEGKNVFYWFQNHKARERQKRRRQIDEQQQQRTPQSQDTTNLAENRETAAAGSNRPVAEVEQVWSWASPTNSSTVAEQRQTVSPQGDGPSKAVDADRKADDGWLHYEEEEEANTAELIQQQRRNGTWQMMHLSPENTIINTCSATTATCSTVVQSEPQKTQKDLITIFSGSLRGGEAAETLELFPLRSGGTRPGTEEEEELGRTTLDDSNEVGNPYQFFEFLPLKN